MRVLVVASTFPTSDLDEAPAFVKQLVEALGEGYPQLQLDVLAPQWLDKSSRHVHHEHFEEYRFGYFWPRSWQRLAGRGILPAIQERPLFLLMLPFLFVFEAVALMRLVMRSRPDVIYAHWFTPQGVLAALVSKRTGVPYVLTSHAEDVRVWRKLPFAGPLIVRRLLPRAKRITAVSAATRDKMRGFFSDREWRALESRVAVLPMGVDLAALGTSSDSVKAVDQAFALEQRLAGKQLIAFIGRLVEKKGLGYLIAAVAEIVRDPARRDIVLLVAGTGPLRAQLEAQVEHLSLQEHVRFLGYTSGSRKLSLLRRAQVVVVPSIETANDSEGFPVTVLEALAAGTVCVATDATHADEVLVDGVNGFVVPQQDARALADAVLDALTLSDDRRSELTAAARAAAADYDWSVIARRHHDFLLAPFEPRDMEAGCRTSA